MSQKSISLPPKAGELASLHYKQTNLFVFGYVDVWLREFEPKENKI